MHLRCKMRVRCIETDKSDLKSNFITYGKVYDVVEEVNSVEGPAYHIIGDRGKLAFVFSYRFEVLKEKEMSSKKVTALRNWRNQVGSITLGKVYDVVNESVSGYFVRDDNNSIVHLTKSYFTESPLTTKVATLLTGVVEPTTEYVLPNGMVLKGTLTQVNEALSKMGVSFEDGVHYMSATKGLMVIKDMATGHIKNAFLKKYRIWLDKLATLPHNEMVVSIQSGNSNDITFVALLRELISRKE